MNVLSLFDGMSCGQIALERAGFEVKNYFACEIDKFAITVTMSNYPNTKQLGDVTKVSALDLPKLDLVIGGSPCQGFSFAGKQLNFEDPRSKLFFEFVRLLDEARVKNPNVKFLLENVKMKKEYQDVISNLLGVQPVEINSSLVSAQNRKRLYWTNLGEIGQPEDRGILLKDIMESGEADRDKSLTVTTRVAGATADRYLNKSMHQMIKMANVNPSGNGMNGNVYSTEGKSPTLTTNKGEGSKICTKKRRPLQISPSRESNGKQPYMQNRVYSDEGLSPCLTQFCRTLKMGLDEFYWRKLTPIECERLQTVPDNYTAAVSNSQRYKMLGNGWTVDVITHILLFDLLC